MGLAAPENEEERAKAALFDQGYEAGWHDAIEDCATVAARHKGSYTNRPQYKANMRAASPEALVEIRAEERGEDIASEVIAREIRKLASA